MTQVIIKVIRPPEMHVKQLSQPNPTPTQQQLNLTRLRLDTIITPNPPHPPPTPPTQTILLVERILER